MGGVLPPPTKGVLTNSELSRQLTTSNRINGADDVAPPAYSLIEDGQPNRAPLVSQGLPVWAVPFEPTSQSTSNQHSSPEIPESLSPGIAPPVQTTRNTMKLLKMCYEQSSALTRSSEQFQVKIISLSLDFVSQIHSRHSQLTFCSRKSSVQRAGCFSFRSIPPLQ
jgi:hypothetical protein